MKVHFWSTLDGLSICSCHYLFCSVFSDTDIRHTFHYFESLHLSAFCICVRMSDMSVCLTHCGMHFLCVCASPDLCDDTYSVAFEQMYL